MIMDGLYWSTDRQNLIIHQSNGPVIKVAREELGEFIACLIDEYVEADINVAADMPLNRGMLNKISQVFRGFRKP